MNYEGNSMIDGDSGDHSFSPRYNPSEHEVPHKKCDFCKNDRPEEGGQMIQHSLEWICGTCIRGGEDAIQLKRIRYHYMNITDDKDEVQDLLMETVKEVWGQRDYTKMRAQT